MYNFVKWLPIRQSIQCSVAKMDYRGVAAPKNMLLRLGLTLFASQIKVDIDESKWLTAQICYICYHTLSILHVYRRTQTKKGIFFFFFLNLNLLLWWICIYIIIKRYLFCLKRFIKREVLKNMSCTIDSVHKELKIIPPPTHFMTDL